MDRQLTLRIPADLAERLEAAAKQLRRKRSEVMRTALEQFLETGFVHHPIEHVRDLLGQIESGLPDLGERHREYLVQRLRHGR